MNSKECASVGLSHSETTLYSDHQDPCSVGYVARHRSWWNHERLDGFGQIVDFPRAHYRYQAGAT